MAAKKAAKTSVRKTAKKVVSKTAKKSASKKPAAKKPVPQAKKAPQGLLGDVQQLMEMMASHDVTKIDLVDGERKIAIERGTAVMAAPAAVLSPTVAAPAPASAAALAAPAEAAPAEESNLLEIVSPMVGTFYAAPSPDSPAFVQMGDAIGPETVVCIVEAMKVMNEIKAELKGTIVDVCVENAQPVEFGQVLFRLKP